MPQNTKTIQIQYFALMREERGLAREDYVTSANNARELFEELKGKYHFSLNADRLRVSINDEFADGRDVSWLWDVDFEMLAAGSQPIATAGIRGADMANRLKYAGVDEGRLMPLDGTVDQALAAFLDRTSGAREVSILPTYTAMLAVRDALGNAGAVERFWEE